MTLNSIEQKIWIVIIDDSAGDSMNEILSVQPDIDAGIAFIKDFCKENNYEMDDIDCGRIEFRLEAYNIGMTGSVESLIVEREQLEAIDLKEKAKEIQKLLKERDKS